MSEAAIPDYGTDTPTASADRLKQISDLADHLRELELEAAKKEEDYKAAAARVREVAEQQLPLLMAEVGLATFTTSLGVTIAIDEQLRVSVPKKNAQAVCDWLEEKSLGDLIKRAFIIRFGRDDEKWASKFERDCKQRKKALDIERTTKVEPATLKKALNDMLEKGTDVPLKLFGAYHQKTAKTSVKE